MSVKLSDLIVLRVPSSRGTDSHVGCCRAVVDGGNFIRSDHQETRFIVAQFGNGIGLEIHEPLATVVRKGLLEMGLEKKAAVPTEADHVKAVQAPGRYSATVGSEAEARRIVQQALPHATEVPRGVAGQTYPQAAPGVKAWYQVQPPEPDVGNMLPHVKYEDWTGGKKFKGGRWGHLFFPHSE